MQQLSIELVSDFVCPWCLIGKHRLERALEQRPELTARVTFSPFLLDPTTPQEGVDLRDHLRKKYGDPEPLFRRVEQVAHNDGIELDFSRVRRGVSTLRAHTLMRLAEENGLGSALATQLFGAYFAQGRDISAMDVLLELAEAAGLSRGSALTLLEAPIELGKTRDAAAQQAAKGIRGVPFAIFGGTVAVSGAQPREVFEAAIDQALAA